MSSIDELQSRALEIRSKYEIYETKKYGKSWTVEQLIQGFSKDVSDLQQIINSDPGNIQKIHHELRDCLWSILVIASKLGVDIEKAFFKTMDELDIRLDGEIK